MQNELLKIFLQQEIIYFGPRKGFIGGLPKTLDYRDKKKKRGTKVKEKILQ